MNTRNGKLPECMKNYTDYTVLSEGSGTVQYQKLDTTQGHANIYKCVCTYLEKNGLCHAIIYSEIVRGSE